LPGDTLDLAICVPPGTSTAIVSSKNVPQPVIIKRVTMKTTLVFDRPSDQADSVDPIVFLTNSSIEVLVCYLHGMPIARRVPVSLRADYARGENTRGAERPRRLRRAWSADGRLVRGVEMSDGLPRTGRRGRRGNFADQWKSIVLRYLVGCAASPALPVHTPPSRRAMWIETYARDG
jgi:hypothetical protein